MKISDLSPYTLGIYAAIAILAGCGGSQQVGQPPPAPQKTLYYVVQNLGSLGGRDCCGEHIAISNNNRGWVAERP